MRLLSAADLALLPLRLCTAAHVCCVAPTLDRLHPPCAPASTARSVFGTALFHEPIVSAGSDGLVSAGCVAVSAPAPQHLPLNTCPPAPGHNPPFNTTPAFQVIVRDITFAALSEHTLLPFHGRCHIAYVPRHGVVLGLSKLARVTKCLAARLQTQQAFTERLIAAVAEEVRWDGGVSFVGLRKQPDA